MMILDILSILIIVCFVLNFSKRLIHKLVYRLIKNYYRNYKQYFPGQSCFESLRIYK